MLAWMAAGTDQASDPPVRPDVPVAMGGASPPSTTYAPDLGGEPYDTPPPEAAFEPVVPREVIAPIETATAPPPVIVNEPPSMRDADSVDSPRPMIVPVAGVPRTALRDM